MLRPALVTLALWLAIALTVPVGCGRGGAPTGADDVATYLANRGRVAIVGSDELRSISAEGVEWADRDALETALRGTDEAALLAAMRDADIAALLVERGEGAPPSMSEALPLAERLTRYGAFSRLGCVVVTPRVALYEPRPELVLEPLLAGAVAHIARAVVAGVSVPRVQSFPEPLRRIHNVEVLVMLSDAGRPRLWRSARGSSIARALLTAAVVARQRWMEREAAMGGPLDRLLPSLDVEVLLLDEDGTLSSRSASFVDSVFGPDHGVAFDQRGNWRYLLPAATAERGEGSAMRAYGALFEDADMPADSIERPDLRLYRSLARPLASSPAPARLPGAGSDGRSEVGASGGTESFVLP